MVYNTGLLIWKQLDSSNIGRHFGIQVQGHALVLENTNSASVNANKNSVKRRTELPYIPEGHVLARKPYKV
jgi:hypothetical protein